jgi:hypothetical protein
VKNWLGFEDYITGPLLAPQDEFIRLSESTYNKMLEDAKDIICNFIKKCNAPFKFDLYPAGTKFVYSQIDNSYRSDTIDLMQYSWDSDYCWWNIYYDEGHFMSRSWIPVLYTALTLNMEKLSKYIDILRVAYWKTMIKEELKGGDLWYQLDIWEKELEKK